LLRNDYARGVFTGKAMRHGGLSKC